MANSINHQRFPIHQNPSGSTEVLHIIDIDSGNAGPNIYLQASVHGAEVQGNLTLFKLYELLKETPFNGRVRLVPLANPRGINQKQGTFTQGRFNPVTGHNWNRNYTDISKHIDTDEFAKNNQNESADKIQKKFKELLSKQLEKSELSQKLYGPQENKLLNITLQKLAASADVVLDLHTGPVACRYLYVPEYLKKRSQDLGFPYAVIIPHEFAGAMDEASFMPWVKLAQSLKTLGVSFENPFEAYTVELGSEEKICEKRAEDELSRITHYLAQRGVLPLSEYPKVSEQQNWGALKDFKTYFAPSAGLVEYQVGVGEKFKAGDQLGRILTWPNDTQKPWHTITAQADGALINHSPSAVISQGMELFQVLENLEPFSS